MSALRRGLIGILSADATLAGLAPGGVWHDVAPQATVLPFVIVSLQTGADEPQFGGVAWQECLYLVKAVAATATAAESVAARIQALLEGATLTLTGYASMSVRRDDLVEQVEVDGDRRWYHEGGSYRIFACPTS